MNKEKSLLLQSFRIRKGLKQSDIALLLDISPTSYSYKESGKRQFKMQELAILKQCLELTDQEFSEIFD